MAQEPYTEESATIEDTKNPVNTEESFEALLEQSDVSSVRLSPGQRVRARVVGISGDLVYIDLGGKTDGVISAHELLDEEGNLKVHEGDDIEAFFVSVQDGVRKLTTLIHGYAATQLSALQGAHEAGVPVVGDVKGEVKGGFEISVGGVRCFCPHSQIDLRGGRNTGEYVGNTYSFKVIEFKEDGRNIILSRRTLLEEEKRARLEELKQTITVGSEVTGTVSSLQKFGAFVDLGAIEALIPLSEVSWERTANVRDVLATGQTVTGKVISVDWDRNRISLSLKALTPDPWTIVAEKYLPDTTVKGTVVRLAPFGVFVNLEPGVDGLIHISNLGAGRRIKHPGEVIETGREVEAHVLSVDQEKRKISLSLQKKVEPKEIQLPAEGDFIEGTVEKVMPYGIFMKFGDSMTGLIPNSEMATPGGSDHSRMFPEGSPVQAVVIGVDKESGKVRLSRKEVLAKTERDEYEQYRDSQGSTKGLSTFGELLKAKLEEQKTKQEA